MVDIKDWKAGRYKVKTFKGNISEIEIIEYNGELGAWFNMLREFVNVKDFVELEVLSYDSQ
jgi:hypothetical protein